MIWKRVDVVGVRSPACQYLAHAVLSDASAVARRLGAAVRHVPLMVPIILGLLLIPSIWTASAQISDGVVRTGLLNDQSSIYVDDGGPGRARLGSCGPHGDQGPWEKEAR
jgi:hypothetical protein